MVVQEASVDDDDVDDVCEEVLTVTSPTIAAVPLDDVELLEIL